MKKVIGILLAVMLSVSLGYSNDLYNRYYSELKGLKDPQLSLLILTYFVGHKEGLSMVLTSIIWKESMFGKYIINKGDGKYGSFGIGQILLTSAASRHKVTTEKGRRDLQLRLLTDHRFNLNEALTELLYWKKQYVKKSQFWTTHMIASYNNGWKGYKDKGKDYADDTKLRRKVLVDYFSDPENLKHPVFEKYLLVIRADMVKQGMIKSTETI